MFPPASPGLIRLANRAIFAGLALGILGMVMSFSYPGFVAFFAGQVIIIGGGVLGRTWRHAVLAAVAIAATWLMRFVFGWINALAISWLRRG